MMPKNSFTNNLIKEKAENLQRTVQHQLFKKLEFEYDISNSDWFSWAQSCEFNCKSLSNSPRNLKTICFDDLPNWYSTRRSATAYLNNQLVHIRNEWKHACDTSIKRFDTIRFGLIVFNRFWMLTAYEQTRQLQRRSLMETIETNRKNIMKFSQHLACLRVNYQPFTKEETDNWNRAFQWNTKFAFKGKHMNKWAQKAKDQVSKINS